MKQLALIILISLSFSMASFGQSDDSTTVKTFMNQAKAQIREGDYASADVTFRRILNLKTFIPDELCFYYGKTLLETRQFSLSKNFLNKYIDLTDSSGPLIDTTYALLDILEKKFEAINACETCDENGFLVKMETCQTCEGVGRTPILCDRCAGSGTEVCKICFGEKVEVQRTSFGRRYVPCSNCGETGSVTCSKCQGAGEYEGVCKTCKGKGEIEHLIQVID